MKKIIIDAKKLMEASDPVLCLGQLYGYNTNNWEDLAWKLTHNGEYTVTFMTNWADEVDRISGLVHLLESIQQHSSNFFLVWDGDANFLDVSSINNKS